MELHRNSPFQAHFDGAVFAGLLQDLPRLGIEVGRQFNPDLELGDLPRRFAGHDFLHPGRAPLEIPVVPLGDDPHDREDAGVQCCGHEVGGREALPLALVVGWRIGFQG